MMTVDEAVKFVHNYDSDDICTGQEDLILYQVPDAIVFLTVSKNLLQPVVSLQSKKIEATVSLFWGGVWVSIANHVYLTPSPSPTNSESDHERVLGYS